ncbi:MAG: dihydroorotase [Candidatus Aenigmarchaeota archaeon]|nr:dihydroorotase [Candidatus Aenigmarchaeota archaeon]
MKLLIKQGRVVDPANGIDAVMDILVDNGKIAKVAKSISEKAEVVDARNLIVAPGLIDMHAHLREPGREDKETIATATRAAARGGFTTVLGMPNTNPVIDDQAAVEFVLSKARKEGVVNVYTTGAATKNQQGKELAEMWELRNAGAVAISDDGNTIPTASLMRKVLEYARMYRLPYLSHAEDPALSEGGAMHEGYVSTELGLQGRPSVAEDVIVAREILLAKYTQGRVHFCHGSTQGAVELVKQAKKAGISVTMETCPHYFSLTDEAVRGYNQNAKVSPPLRSKEHVEAIKKGLKDDVIDVIATDHAPHLLVEKYVEFDNAASGMVGLETAVPLVMNNLVHAGVLTISQAIAKMTINPARILGIPKGTLSVGADADITIIDPNREETIDPKQFESKGRNTPFAGMTLKGVPVMTIVAGKAVMRERRVVG